ncbi:MAG: hypothetical protein WAN75_32670, partial [Xanthobacteraceae bacterium]
MTAVVERKSLERLRCLLWTALIFWGAFYEKILDMMEPQPAPVAPGVLARLSPHLDWYWTLSPPGRAAFWATFGGWALDAYNQMTLGFVLPAVTAAFALSTT